LTAAIQLGRQLDDPRLLSYALGNLGALYQSEQRVEEALYLTREALKTAERADASDSLYRWHWQEGQLLWAQGQTQAAVESYQRAVDILEETRQETLGRYGASASYFGQSLAPVYLELTSALLIAAGRLEGTESFDALLKNARQTMEQLKAAELRNYFRNECVADLESKERPLELVADNAAVIYPILLPDRVELLVSGPSGLARYPVPVPGPQVSDMARIFRRNLQTPISRSYLESAKNLYDWLVRPYASQLEKQGVDTLIFVPDGVLRTIPMTALHDGERFLGTQFAIGVTPGLSLVDPQPLDRDHTTLMLGGLSESTGGFEALPKVADEISAIEALYGGKVLLNDDFQTARIETALIEDPPSVAHFASHAVFTGNPETSFLLTHDGKLTLDEMADLVGPTQYRKKPLELLLLSACETAAGDERAALGLAGVAIRSGARSAIGSLWKISDEAAYELVVAFYTELHDHPSISKAVALQRAQQKLLDGGRFAHPYFWSPYILIGNWL
jgi:CHAT domain-containing protein